MIFTTFLNLWDFNENQRIRRTGSVFGGIGVIVKRIQRKRTKGWKMPKNTVYVGRPTIWGNPFKIGSNASRFSINLPTHLNTIEDVLKCYKYFAESWLHISPNWLDKLKGKDLACWCPVDRLCHADVLLELLK